MAALLGEAPYVFDAQMLEDARKQHRAKIDRNRARASELALRLVSRAEAHGWPADSLMLAMMHLEVVQMLANLRVGKPEPVLTPSETELHALGAAMGIIFARLEAGTLLRDRRCDLAAYEALTSTDNKHLSFLEGDLGCSEARNAPYLLGYLATLKAARMILRHTLCAWQEHEFFRGDDGQEYVATKKLRPELERLLDIILMVRRATLWRNVRHGGAASEAFPPRRNYFDEEAYLLYFLELADHALSNDPFATLIADPEDAAMLRRMLREFSELMDACLRGGGGCAAARRTVACMEGNVHAREERRRANWAPRACAQCGALEAEPKQWKVCAKCGDAAYCSKAHQVQHWRAGHKAACRQGASAGAA